MSKDGEPSMNAAPRWSLAYASVVEGLFRPSTEVSDPAERQNARLLAKLTVVECLFLSASSLSIWETMVGAQRARLETILLPAMVLMLVAYGLSRSRWVRASAVLTTMTQFAVPFTVMTTVTGVDAFDDAAWSVIALLIASSVLSVRGTVVTWLASIVAVTVAYRLAPGAWKEGEISEAAIYVVTSGLCVVVSHVHRNRVEAARASELVARNRELETLKHTLEERIAARTQALSRRNADLRLVLDNVDQALFTVDRDGVISSERSAMLTEFFGAPQRADTLVTYFERVDPTFSARLDLGWAEIGGIMPLELVLDQLPKALVVSGKHYAFGYQSIGGNGEPERFLVVVTDATAEIERGVAERDRRETLALLDRMLVDGPGLRDFLDDGSAIVASLGAGGTELGPLFRAIHTLKGNAASYGLKSVADLCHQLETLIQETQRPPRRVDVANLKERWGRITWEIERILGARRGVLEIAPAEAAGFEQAIELGASPAEILAAFRSFKLEPIEPRFRHFAEQAKSLAARLGKPGLMVDISAEQIRLEPGRWSPFLGTLLHAVRNAIDHGIETPETRLARGKPSRGRLALRASLESERLVFEVADDGAGIDWLGLEAKCRALGMGPVSDEDLAKALFADGISTAAAVTDISGRGAGMGALLAAARALGGEVEVDSVRGAGTRIRVVFPKAMASEIPPDRRPRRSLAPLPLNAAQRAC